MTFSHIPRNPDTKTLRLFALLCVVLLGGTGLPIVLTLLLFGVLVFLSSTAAAPFIYTLF